MSAAPLFEDVDDSVQVLGPEQWLRSDWCAATAPPQASGGRDDEPLPLADVAAARTAVRQLWKPLGDNKGLNAAQLRWMNKIKSKDLSGPVPPRLRVRSVDGARN